MLAKNGFAVLQRLYRVKQVNIEPCRCVATYIGVRSFREMYRSLLNFWYRYMNEGSKLRSPPVPPYKHVCQVGDPVLRARANQVKIEDISTREFKKIIANMKQIMEDQCLVGLSAPQIGLSWQVFVMGYKERDVRKLGADVKIWDKEEPIPFTVFINPHKLMVTDNKVVKAQEGCGSVIGYSATVPRYEGVQITAYDENGKLVVRKATGLAARIIQHEMDHLQGKLFVDIMDPLTFNCAFWSVINASRGRATLRFKV